MLLRPSPARFASSTSSLQCLRLPALVQHNCRDMRTLHSSAICFSGHSKWSKIRHKKGKQAPILSRWPRLMPCSCARRRKESNKNQNFCSNTDSCKTLAPDMYRATNLHSWRTRPQVKPKTGTGVAACEVRCNKSSICHLMSREYDQRYDRKSDRERLATYCRRRCFLGKLRGHVTWRPCYRHVTLGSLIANPLNRDAVTNNKARTVSTVKSAVSSAGGSLARVLYQFVRKGVIVLHSAKDVGDILEEAIDIGAEDVSEAEDGMVKVRSCIMDGPSD